MSVELALLAMPSVIITYEHEFEFQIGISNLVGFDLQVADHGWQTLKKTSASVQGLFGLYLRGFRGTRIFDQRNC